jgi:lipopolysaccharide biosynthesis regulator YciM
MHRFSKTALAAAMVAALGGVILTTPASARKKEQPASDGSFVLSKEVRASASAARTALAANDYASAESAVSALEAQARNDDERYVALTLRVALLTTMPPTTRSMTALVDPLEALIANSRTQPADRARYTYMRGDIAYASKQYARAVQFYQRARDGGMQDDELNFQIVRANMEGGEIVAGADALDTIIKAQIAAGKKPPENWYRYVLKRLFTAQKNAEVSTWTVKWLAAYPSPQNWRDAIYNLGFRTDTEKRLTDQDRIDLYRLMAATHSLAGQSDYLDYANAALALKLSAEARSVLDAGRGGGVFVATDKSIIALAAKAKAGAAADKTLAAREKAAAAAATGDPAALLGDAFIGAHAYPKAIAMYDLALSKNAANVDAVHLHRGIAYAMSGDKEKARADFAAVTAAPQTEIAALWTAWLNAPAA